MFFLSFLAGYAYTHIVEWFLHKSVLHRFGRRKNSVFGFHWKTHHRVSRKNNFYDASYKNQGHSDGSAKKEDLYLMLLAGLHLPIAFFNIFFFLGILLGILEYRYKHKKSHLNPKWAIENIPWHYEHHMGKNQNTNFGVRSPILDKIFGTYVESQSIKKVGKNYSEIENE